MEYLWLILTVVFIIAEAVTFQLVSIWFAIGSIAALITQLAGGDLLLQTIIFVAVTVICLAATRPLVRKIRAKAVSTNVDRVIGQRAIVTEKIDNIENVGQVKVNGMVWSARSSGSAVISKDALVKVEKIEGVKLLVSEIK